MYILSVSPFVDGIPYEELSYFSKQEVQPGALVEVLIRKRVCRALVVESTPLHKEKQSIKQASFVTKKIIKVIKDDFLPPLLWNAIAYNASCALRKPGTVAYDLISEKAFATLSHFPLPTSGKGFELLLLEQSYEYRILRFKTTIREMFSKKKSLAIFFPTAVDLENAVHSISKGIDEYVVALHGGLTEKQYTTALTKLTTTEHPVVILSTPSLLPWLREDLGAIIVEREHSHYYYTHGDNSYDMRPFLEGLAKAVNIPCVLSSHMMSLRAHMLHQRKDAHEVMPLQFRNDTNLTVVSMTEENRTSSPYLSRQALSILHAIKKYKQGHYFLYAHRKGMYPTTVCSDCGELFTCTACKRPYVLHKIGGVRTYVCHGCESIVQITEETSLNCRYCGGWRMATLGIATTGIEEELSRLGLPLFVIDGERTPTKAKVKKVHKEWLDAPYGILIGTEMAHNIVTKCDGIIILSLDSLFSLPEYRTDEKIISLVTEMSEKVEHDEHNDSAILLQTRLKQSPVIKHLTTPSFREVYATLLKEREQFMLPPYFTVVRASYENLSDDLRKRFQEELEPHTTVWFEQGKGVTLLFIHIKQTEWHTNDEAREKVKRVTEGAHPTVNPLHFFM